MTSLVVLNNITNKNQIDYSEKDSFDALYHELDKGVQSIIDGDCLIQRFFP